MKFFVLAVAIIGVFATAAPRTRFNTKLHQGWEAYKIKHGKSYETDAEEHQRRGIWESNFNKIQQHNIRHRKGVVTYSLDMNKYGDMTNSELTRLATGHKQSDKSCDCCGSCQLFNSTSELLNMANDDKDCSCCSDCKNLRPKFVSPLNLQIPTSVDWRKTGYVTSVKDQGDCGSCWAFSALGSLEGQISRKSNKLISLSEQNLIHCSYSEGNDGCNGGRVDQAFEYIKKNGVETLDAYNYTGEDIDYCHPDSANKLAKGMEVVHIPSGDEKALTTAIALIGPISVLIDGSQESFTYYSGGVYNDPVCSNTETQLRHAVLVVGYGTSSSGDYYIVKNSWGEHWGHNGYMLMSRNKDNQCGIATAASYPLFE